MRERRERKRQTEKERGEKQTNRQKERGEREETKGDERGGRLERRGRRGRWEKWRARERMAGEREMARIFFEMCGGGVVEIFCHYPLIGAECRIYELNVGWKLNVR